jgi:hypothetical protein
MLKVILEVGDIASAGAICNNKRDGIFCLAARLVWVPSLYRA